MCFTEQALCQRTARNEAPQRVQPAPESVLRDRKILESRTSSKVRGDVPEEGMWGRGSENLAQIKDRQWSLAVGGGAYL